MKKLITLSLLVAALISVGEEVYISPITGKPIPNDGKVDLQKIKERDVRVLKKTGGFLLRKAEGPQLLLVDARDKATLTVDEVARVYKLGTTLDANVEKKPRGEKCPLKFAQEIMAAKSPLLIVVVAEKVDALPALSVYPEERIGIVNADKLKGGDDPSAPEMRVAKEMWRAIGFITGVGFSAQENDMMQPYYTLKELDSTIHAYIQPMNMAKMYKFWQRFGVKKEARIPYRIACEQGWAPQPTNDYQKAVWNEVFSVPDKPIKIEKKK